MTTTREAHSPHPRASANTRTRAAGIILALGTLTIVAFIVIFFLIALFMRDPCPSLDLAKGVGCTVHDGSWGPL